MIERQTILARLMRDQGIAGLDEDARRLLMRTRPLTAARRRDEAAQLVARRVRIDVALWASGADRVGDDMPPPPTRDDLAADAAHIRQWGHV